MPQTKELKPITKKVIWLFAIGQLGWSLMSAILTNFIESFYQPDDVSVKEGMIYFIPQGRVILGVFTIIGGIYAIGRVFDAITDPWIGNLSDKSRNPKGRRIPFMKKAAIPLALITIMVYICPTAGNPVASKLGSNGVINAIWVLVMMLLFYLFMTIYCTPYNALIAELSRDEKTLADISTAISFTFIFGSAMGYMAPTIWSAITPMVGSRVWAMRVVFIVMAVIACICCLIPALTINEPDYVDVVPTEGSAFSSLVKCFSNKNFGVFVGSDIYKRLRHTMQYGDFYRMSDEENSVKWVVTAPDASQAVGMVLVKETKPGIRYENLKFRGLDPDARYHVYNMPMDIDVRTFGSMINQMAPVHIKPGSVMESAVAHFVKMHCEILEENVSGGLLMNAGINLPPAFTGTGYNEHTRVMCDYSSRLYIVEKIEEKLLTDSSLS